MNSRDTYVGYGSLISPSVIGGYFLEEREEKVQQKFSEKTGYEEPEQVLREDFVEKWREVEDEVELIPVRIQGLEISYSYESRRGGLMLAARENEDRWINGVVIRGLPEKQQEIIEDVESTYLRRRISLDRIEVYDECSKELEQKPLLFFENPEDRDFEAEGEINLVYHKTILAGIELLGEEYGEDFAGEFKQDFLETTFHEGERLAEK
ncbi:MAG: hypothetical protein ABEJ36_02650 [Candidatus Nanosalina sp.]